MSMIQISVIQMSMVHNVDDTMHVIQISIIHNVYAMVSISILFRELNF